MLEVLDGAYRAWRECLRSLPECDSESFDDFMAGPLLANRTSTLAEWRASSYVVENVDSYDHDVLEVNLEFTIPYVLVCERDGATLVERRPGQEDRIVDQRYVERIREAHLLQGPRGWRVEGFATREQVEGEVGALCG